MKYELKTNYEYMFNKIVQLGIEYIRKHNIKALVLGSSGGIDSAISAVIASKICADLQTDYMYYCKVIGASLPIKTNTEAEQTRAVNIINAFCNVRVEVDLTEEYNVLIGSTETENDPIDTKIRNGNIKARLRMIQLYHLAHTHRGVVLSTDNLTEYMLGFWTLHGDVGDLGLIQQLWKTEIYGLAWWLEHNGFAGTDSVLIDCITAVPTDGLGITSSDFEQLGYDSYEEIDKVLLQHLNEPGTVDLNDPVVKRHEATHFKRNNPFNLKREDIT